MHKIYVAFVLLLMSLSVGYAQPVFEQRSLEEALNPDGTLKRGVQGSFKVEGYTMRTGKNGEPIFLPQLHNAASGTWDTQFGLPVPGIAGEIRALAIDRQGNVYVGGAFRAVGGISTVVNNIVQYNVQTNSWSALGTGANNGVSFAGLIGGVHALAVDGQGRVYVGGDFTQAGGVSANNVARFDPATNSWSALGAGVSFSLGSGGEVNALAIDGQGRVYVGGDFTQAGGVSANNVARFDPATNSWSALGTGANNGVSDTSFFERVNALAIDRQGRIYVGGRFTRAGEVSANRVARFDPQANSWSALGTGANNGISGDETSFPGPSVSALAVDEQGRVYVGGDFTQAGGVSARSVARFDPATNSWSALGTGANNGVSGSVNALAIDGQGRVYVGGRFPQAGEVSANNVARFDPQANSWSALGTGSSNGVSVRSPISPALGVSALAVDGQGRVYVGGRFAEAGGVSASSVARFNPATNSWSALGTGGGSGTNDIVRALAVDGQGRVYVGGLFTQAGGVSANSVARFDPATNSWSTLGTGANNGVTITILGIPGLPLPPDFVLPGIVGALAVDGQGNVYVGGFFTRAGGVSANSVARFNPATNSWSALGTGSSNGVSGSRNPILPIPSVSALAVDGQGRVYVGGDFTEAGGVSARSVARFNPATNSWSALGTGANNGVSGDETPLSGPSVSALAVDGQGRVYVGGRFTRAGEVSANRVARFDPQANSWSALGTGANNGISGDETPFSGPSVSALAVDGQGRVYVGGRFTSAGGVSANSVARFDPQANSWSALGTGANNGVSGDVFALAVVGVFALAVDGQGRVYVGGDFTQAGEVSANNVARFDPQANSWSALGTGANNGVGGITSTISVGVNTFAVDRQGRVYVGGNFTTAGDVVSAYIARWNSAASRIEQISADVPKTFLLEQNYPNPFNPSTTIRYQLPVASEVKLEVYDVLGKKVATLVSERQAAGYYQYVWNADGLTSGVYFYRLQAGGFVETKKMMLVK
jgi:N-acetylneuraminic acid mutarotase